MNIGIVGLGLIGGSMAKSVKSRTAHTVYGTDLDGETMTLARLYGAMDGALTEENLGTCGLILLAVPPAAAVAWVKDYAGQIGKGAVVVDLCGVKRAVVGELGRTAREAGFLYVGGHPMAGTERNGFPASREDLYAGASMILTPEADTPPQVLEFLRDFFLDLGFAGITFSTPEEHDRIIAFTSQLAHVVSGAYVKSPEARRRRGFSAGSFRDMTRVARLDENLWTELMLDNADFLSGELDILIGHLQQYAQALKAGDADRLRDLLREGREAKAAAGGN